MLARTSDGGGSAFAGWQSGRPFYGNLCFPDVPEPLPPDEGTAVVTKVGELVDGDVVFTVTATNPTTEVAPDVVVIEALPAKLTPWTVPPECTLGAVDFIARCEIGDLAGGASVDLEFSATPPAGVCGAFSNYALTTVDSPIVRSADLVIVDVPCPPDPPPDPLILMTKEVSATVVTAPGTITYTVSFENAGPGTATNVTFTDELSPDFVWSLGSGSNVCSIEGTTLTCFAETVPDGVFEVLEITATIDGTSCGTFDNNATVTFEGGQEAGSVTATAPTVEVTGCPAPAPADTPAPTADAESGFRPDRGRHRVPAVLAALDRRGGQAGLARAGLLRPPKRWLGGGGRLPAGGAPQAAGRREVRGDGAGLRAGGVGVSAARCGGCARDREPAVVGRLPASPPPSA